MPDAIREARWALAEEASEVLPEVQRDGVEPVPLRVSPFEPWWAQRLVMRSEAGCRVLVAGRQSGKTEIAVHLTISIALERPGSYSVLLAPTFPIARTAIDTMRARCKAIPGARWHEAQKRLIFPNGSIWQVFSAGRKEAVRGPTLDGLLWVDEAAYIPREAWDAALGTLTAVKAPLKLLTTTPAGKNWVYDEFVSTDPQNAAFRFRSQDSPYANLDEIRANRAKMSPEKAAQEYEAAFVDSLILAFPDTSRLFVPRLRDRAGEPDLRNTLGVDLGKDQDWTVVTLINGFGEARILGRWQHQSWPDSESRILTFIRAHDVGLCCVDKGYVGSYLIDRLEHLGVSVLPVNTYQVGAKAVMVEAARADVQHERVWVEEGPLADLLRHEMSRFQGTKKLVHGPRSWDLGCSIFNKLTPIYVATDPLRLSVQHLAYHA